MKNLILLVMCFFSSVINSQSQEKKSPELEWIISFKNNHVVFECAKGCNYSYLSFNADRKVILNENTTVNLEKNPEERNDSNFLVQYSKSGNVIHLEGIKGVAWENITLLKDLNLKYCIDQTGLIKKITT
ncbi:hypothetical protein [Kaistella jeonii]|nr:hypothetical protein [Kaistella jeonii]SFC09788.1 hypothetical protein SAMN05421876_106118 [Kaistella jeonii]VEI95243.1 Uncharacterised protein [Kaistella jeonii]